MKRILSFLLISSILLSFGCSGETQPKDTTAPDTTIAETTSAPETTEPDIQFEMREDQVYAADLWDTSETLTFAFLGGSITNGNVIYPEVLPWWPTSSNTWTNNILSYFAPKYRGVKSIKAVNIGLPGTTSDFGPARFADQAAVYEPDVVFIEYTVNDVNMPVDVSSENIALFYEHIIRQCLELDKIPSIVFVHTALPEERTGEKYERWLNNVTKKDELAAHYGITTINIYDRIENEHKTSGTELSFLDYLGKAGADYFSLNEEGTAYDVHPTSNGYNVISTAIIETLENDFSAIFNKPQFAPIIHTDYTNYLGMDYKLTPCTSDRISYDGEWEFYSDENRFTTEDENVHFSSTMYEFPYFIDGIAQALNTSDSSFTFTSDAAGFTLSYVTSLAGSYATAYLVNEDGTNGQELGRINTHSIYSGMDNLGSFVTLPNDGKEHTIRVVVDTPTDINYVLRFGYLIEIA